ncbi:argininosuccinate lyase [Candidatus Oleimmundimicrobium sp.]|uniref:argininosuccinate lyase n=1 Tax=Candidatus Oleimmundimicrobium sp. TaxID=3060597 RepID=UPI00271777A1|nr:argininosuccinate lyase [Candidatus Oleimmundimicrobium sp.]MDO8886118.1 argininosuccinate lyase [Candidatus Oleimmundimicrobium sp.]
MKLWGGRFKKNTNKLVEEFTSSLFFDCRLYKYDIKGSIAHVKMLSKCKIIPPDEAAKIEDGLNEIYREIEANKFVFNAADEDIHMAIERALIDKIGPVGGKLHTARSRNDQVSLDTRFYLKDEIKIIEELILGLQRELMKLAKDNIGIISPGYTHLQHAQPILFSHHLMAYFFMLERDFERLKDCYKRTDVMTLGAGALAGTTFPIDREYVAKQLGFSRVSENSLDSVGDRDFIVDFLSAASLIMVHLSKFCEELVIWSSSEFNFIEIDDAFTTGSSIMPQKKNPDVAELIRGKCGRVFGHLVGLLTTLKALPMAYNRDLQEDKEGLFDTIDTLKLALETFTGMLGSIKVKSENMGKAAKEGFTNATDAADYLTAKGIPFREAHEIVGKMVASCIEKNCHLSDLSLDDFKKFSTLYDKDIFEIIDIKNSVNRKTSFGGTSAKSVNKQMSVAEKIVGKEQAWLA